MENRRIFACNPGGFMLLHINYPWFMFLVKTLDFYLHLYPEVTMDTYKASDWYIYAIQEIDC